MVSLKELLGSPVILLALSAEEYYQNAYKTARELQDVYGSLCYVSIEKPACDVAAELKAAGLRANTLFVAGPAALAEKRRKTPEIKCSECGLAIVDLTVGIFGLIDRYHPAAVVIEPIAAIAKHNPEMEAAKFIHYLANDSRTHKRALVLICKKSELKTKFVKDVMLFVDKVVSD